MLFKFAILATVVALCNSLHNVHQNTTYIDLLIKFDHLWAEYVVPCGFDVADALSNNKEISSISFNKKKCSWLELSFEKKTWKFGITGRIENIFHKLKKGKGDNVASKSWNEDLHQKFGAQAGSSIKKLLNSIRIQLNSGKETPDKIRDQIKGEYNDLINWLHEGIKKIEEYGESEDKQVEENKEDVEFIVTFGALSQSLKFILGFLIEEEESSSMALLLRLYEHNPKSGISEELKKELKELYENKGLIGIINGI